jgi:hypothetical protein
MAQTTAPRERDPHRERIAIDAAKWHRRWMSPSNFDANQLRHGPRTLRSKATHQVPSNIRARIIPR